MDSTTGRGFVSKSHKYVRWHHAQSSTYRDGAIVFLICHTLVTNQALHVRHDRH